MIGVNPEGDARAIFNATDIDKLTIPLWVFDADNSRVVWANQEACRLWQADSMEELCLRDLSADISSAVKERLQQYKNNTPDTDRTFHELWTLYPEGVARTYRIAICGHELPDGRMGLRIEALAESKEAPVQLRSAEALNHIKIGISLFDLAGEPLYSNVAAHKMYGSALPSLKQRFVKDSDYHFILSSIQESESASKICQVQTSEGKRWHELSIMRCFDGPTGKPAFMLSETDVTKLKEKEAKARYLAHFDLLTGLHNRNYVNSHYPAIIEDAIENEERQVIMVIDLDHFKSINETLGHSTGDALLRHVAKSLQRFFGKDAHIARLGGDEFVIVAPFTSSFLLDEQCQAILTAITTECHADGHLVNANASIGIALCPEHGTDLPTLLQHCDLALHDAKNCGRDTYRYYRPSLQKAAIAKRNLENDLLAAIERKEFRLFYQPRVDCQSQQVVSAEALIRWQHPQRGLISPGEFIEALEDTGLIHQVGDWLIEQVGLDQQFLQRNGHCFPISINISPKQFERSDFVRRLKMGLARSHCPAKYIEIEITESMLMGVGFDAKSVLIDLRREGFSIAVDDFGTGYSNLAYIQEYPISSLKVDRSFINMIEDQSSVVNLILSLCRLIGVTAVAEGVENVDQLAWLQMNHCDQYQGFFFSRPIPLDDMLTLLNSSHSSSMQHSIPDILDAEVIWA
ncbi:bifunctional diguanylate cyclase/phosphodiesterase [uncultured Cohaesibacter sp.]|uniref:putative bifunctional diguanylate cyclase/phosphodiesterase n=1 Tax=uncultured Cohaesibacter sp. TaxID=1002546 RepID=UPI00292EBC09|nr:bifunctional diguanylate cyclase/phosphodiesterase [uncultured Cohaesibacter sp.]